MRSQSLAITAVIFDLDGLLVDSEPLQFQAYHHAFRTYGVELAEEEWGVWHELGASAAAWLQFKKVDIDPEIVRAAKKLLYDELIATELNLKPGAQALVEDLRLHGVRMCIASGSRAESIRSCLDRFQLGQHFEGLFSATTTPRKKPHPDVLHLAIRKMCIPDGTCVVLEDSPVGLTAAKAAGLPCVVCPDSFIHRDASEFEGAALLVESLAELDTTILDEIVRA